MKTDLVFDVRLTVPLKALETLMGLADDLDCVLVSANPHVRKAVVQALQKPAKFVEPLEGTGEVLKKIVSLKDIGPALEAKKAAAAKKETMLDPAKKLILDKLRETGLPVSRRTLVKELRQHGFAKNSVGPLCSEMKKDGQITNPRRGYWLASTVDVAAE